MGSQHGWRGSPEGVAIPHLASADIVIFPPYVAVEEAESLFDRSALAPIAGALPAPHVPESGFVELTLLAAVKLTASATVIDRLVSLRIHDETGFQIVEVPASLQQKASESTFYQWGTTLPHAYGISDQDFMIPFPAIPLLPGWDIQVACNNLQVGDQFNAPVYLLGRFPTGPAQSVPFPASKSSAITRPIEGV